MTKATVLGTRLDLVTNEEVLSIIEKWLRKPTKPKVVATAYSEFYVTATKDADFRMALEGCDLVIPDGVGPLAAIYYQKQVKPDDSWWMKLYKGILTGKAIMSGQVGEPVSGYRLFWQLVGRAATKGWRVFLLGGFAGAAGQLREKLKKEYPALQVEAEAGSQDVAEAGQVQTREVIEKINRSRPQLLFVAYGPVKQEKWIMRYKKDLEVGVAIGVGGTFDEALGRVKEAPGGWSKKGLKWLWRLRQQPQRFSRIVKATLVFAWLVFWQGLRKK